MSGHGRTNSLLSPIRVIVRMLEPDCFFRYHIGYGTLQPCLGCQRAVWLCEILRPENPTYTYWQRAARASRGFKMVLFTEPSKHLCRRYMHSTECRSSLCLCLFETWVSFLQHKFWLTLMWAQMYRARAMRWLVHWSLKCRLLQQTELYHIKQSVRLCAVVAAWTVFPVTHNTVADRQL